MLTQLTGAHASMLTQKRLLKLWNASRQLPSLILFPENRIPSLYVFDLRRTIDVLS